jgi:hypothetical protein
MRIRIGLVTHLHVGADSHRIALELFEAAAHRAQAQPPRIGLSRAVYPAADRKTAIAHLDSGVATYVESMVQREFFPAALSQAAYDARSHIHYGHPEEVIASLETDLVLPYTTELICQVHPGHPTAAQMLTALERIAADLAPALGWHKAA